MSGPRIPDDAFDMDVEEPEPAQLRFPVADRIVYDDQKPANVPLVADDDLASWAKRKGPPRKRSFSTGAAAQMRARAEMDAMRATGDWSAARAPHLVALYAHCHRTAYGVEPTELENGRNYAAASAMAKRLVEETFETMQACVDFMRWVWQEEIRKEKWRKENGVDAVPIGWRFQFTPRGTLVTRYRVATGQITSCAVIGIACGNEAPSAWITVERWL